MGTSENDTFYADYVTNAAGNDAKTLNLLDVIKGDAGYDTLIINGKGTAGVAQVNDLTGTITGIEEVIYTGDLTALASDTIDASALDSALVKVTIKTATINAASGASGSAVTNLANAATLGLTGNIVDGAGTATVNASYASTATAAAIALSDAYSSETGNDINVTVNGAKLTDLTISGTTRKTSTITGKLVVDEAAGGNTLTGLVVNGDSSQINVDASNLTGLKTVNLSGSTGETTIASAAAGSTVTITGSNQKDTVTHSANLASTTKLNVNLGAGNDKLSLTSGTIDFLSADVVLNGGDGTDTLGLAYADISDLVNTSKKATVSSFETLAVTGAGTTAQSVDASKLTAFATLQWSGTNTGVNGESGGSAAASASITVTKVQAAHTYSFTSDVTGGNGDTGAEAGGVLSQDAANAITFTLDSDSSADVINLSVGNGAGTTAAGSKVTISAGTADNSGAAAASSIDTSTFETINLASVGVNDTASTTAGTIGTNANVIGGGSNDASIVVAAAATIKVTGTKDVKFDGAISGQNATLDASGLTGGVEATMDGTNNVVKGGSSNNKIDGGAGNDTITTYGGVDEITGSLGRDTIDSGAGSDLIYANDTGSATDRADDTITTGTGNDIVFVSTLWSVTSTANYAYAIDKITDFVGGSDKIKIGAGGAAANAYRDVKSVDTSAAANVLAAATAAMAGSVTKYGAANAANDVYLFTFGGKDYIFMDEATAGAVDTGDALIEVTGISGTVVKTDFLFNA